VLVQSQCQGRIHVQLHHKGRLELLQGHKRGADHHPPPRGARPRARARALAGGGGGVHGGRGAPAGGGCTPTTRAGRPVQGVLGGVGGGGAGAHVCSAGGAVGVRGRDAGGCAGGTRQEGGRGWRWIGVDGGTMQGVVVVHGGVDLRPGRKRQWGERETMGSTSAGCCAVGRTLDPLSPLSCSDNSGGGGVGWGCGKGGGALPT
jgi:hypothetical protein